MAPCLSRRSRLICARAAPLPHSEMLPRLSRLGSNPSAGNLTVEVRQSVQPPVGVFVTELPQTRSLLV